MCFKSKKVKSSKPKRKVSNLMLALSCTMIVLYPVGDFALQYFTQMEVSPTLTNEWFAFWGGEILALASIKITKVIKGEKSEEVAPAVDESNEIINEEE